VNVAAPVKRHDLLSAPSTLIPSFCPSIILANAPYCFRGEETYKQSFGFSGAGLAAG
jgi:hypothetical protein